MSTRLQKKLAKAIIEDAKNKRPTVAKDLLGSVGYSETSIDKRSTKILEAPGVVKELENLGFSEEGAKQVVSELLYDKRVKPQDRLNAADKVFKVHGSYAAEKHVNLNVEVEASKEIKEAAKMLNELYRGASSGSDGTVPGTLGDKASDQE